MKIEQAASEFLASKRIAVTGVSRKPEGHGSNAVYGRLLQRGFDVVPVNPNATTIDGQPCYPNLASIPGGVDAVVIGTAAGHAMSTMEEVVALRSSGQSASEQSASDLHVTKVWMHRSFGPGSVSDEATAFGRANGVVVIDGGCPLMFGTAADGFHKVMCALMKLTGPVPRQVS
jgi:predicted CoA-binding protein